MFVTSGDRNIKDNIFDGKDSDTDTSSAMISSHFMHNPAHHFHLLLLCVLSVSVISLSAFSSTSYPSPDSCSEA